MSDPLFYDEPQKKRGLPSLPRPLLLRGAALAAILIVITAIWMFYPAGESQDQPLPVIRADHDPVKIKPEEPGGMDIAHQDSLIFKTFEQNSTEEKRGKIENLLQEDITPSKREDPVPREELFAGLKPSMKEKKAAQIQSMNNISKDSGASESDTQKKSRQSKVVPNTPSQNKTINITESLDKPVRTSQADESAQKMDKTEPASGTLAEAAKAAEANYYVQLASLKDRAKTDQAWQKLQKQYGTALEGLSPRTQAKEIRGKGTFYRVQAGPLSQEQAASICRKVKARNGGCFVVAK